MKRNVFTLSNYIFIAMRYSSLFILCTAVGSSLIQAHPVDAQGLKERVALHQSEVSLKHLFKAIESQSDYRFVYSSGSIPDEQKVSVSMTAPLLDILNYLKQTTHTHYEAVGRNIVVTYRPPQAPGHITGRVTDQRGLALAGANVKVVELGRSFVTDDDGVYRISLAPGVYTLETRYVSYQMARKTAVAVRTGESVNVDFTLEESQDELSEVVVTALGITREKKQLGYAVQEVSGEEFESASDVNLINALAGKVSGLKINTASELLMESEVILRGEEPIIVVDGVSTKLNYRELNHNDIASISVLKGAVAAALYGAEGRNGALIVTTKRGRENRTSVEVNSTTTVQPGLLTYPRTQTTFGSGGGGKYEYVDGSGAGLEGGGFTWGPKLDGRLIAQWNSPIDPQTGKRTPTPWLDRTGGKGNLVQFLETGFTTVNNVNLESGNEKGLFRASLSHSFQRGMVPNTTMNITGFSMGGNYHVRDWYTIDASLNYSKQRSPNFRTPGYGAQDYIYSLAFWLGSDIDLNDARNYWQADQVNQQQRFQQFGYYNNPYLIVYENLHTYDKNVVFGQLSNNFQLIPDQLDLLVRTGINSSGLEENEHIPKSMLYNGIKSQGDYRVENSRFFRINTDAILTYKKRFGDWLDLDALAGYATTYEQDRLVLAGTDGLSIPGLYTLKNSLNPVINNDQTFEQRIDGLYANINLKIWKPFYLSLTARNDWVSTLPVSNNSFLYPSASLAYVVSDMVDLPEWISLLKLRSSWSQVNAGWTGSTYGHIPTYTIGSYNNLPSMELGGQLIPQDLKPSGSRVWEFGGELSLWKNRVSLDVATYNRSDYDNIISMDVSQASGFGSVRGNGREYERRGLELTLNARPLQGELTWDAGINWSKSHRYLTALEGGKDRDGFIKLGSRVDQLYMFRWMRNADDQVIYNAATGLPTRDTYRRLIGNTDVDFMFGFHNRFAYRDFALQLSFEGQVGGMYASIIPRMKRAGTAADLDNRLREDAANGLKTYVGQGVVVTGGQVAYDFEGNITSDTRTYATNETAVSYEDWVKTYYNVSGSQEEGFLDASYVKLRDVSLSYTFSTAFLQKSRISAATISLIGNNVWLLTRRATRGEDPSWMMASYSNLKSPTPVNYGINVNIKF